MIMEAHVLVIMLELSHINGNFWDCVVMKLGLEKSVECLRADMHFTGEVSMKAVGKNIGQHIFLDKSLEISLFDLSSINEHVASVTLILNGRHQRPKSSRRYD